MKDTLESKPFIDYEWDKKLNGIPGLIAIAGSMILVAIIIFTFIVRIFQFPNLRKRYFVADNTQSVPTRALKTIVFLFLTAGLIGVIIYNIYKMIYGSPKLSMNMEKNKSSPSMSFCSGEDLNLISASYSTNFNKLTEDVDSVKNVIQFNGQKTMPGPNGICYFFNGTQLPELDFNNGGGYFIQFASTEPGVLFFIGDTDYEMDWNQAIPQGNDFSGVGVQLINEGAILQYTETQHLALNGRLYRSFQLFLFFNPPAIVSNGQNLTFAILAPRIITKQIEEPPLTLADFLSNVGGYLGIWGIFGFLFGGSKVNPFGFVSRFVFIKQDSGKLLKELEKMKGDASARLDIPEEEEKDVGSVTEISQPELKNLLAKYYVDMDFYEYAKDT